MNGAIPSATVILLRDRPSPAAELEILLLQRNPAIKNHGGAWVFPGGKLEPSDILSEHRGPSFLPHEHFSSLEAGIAKRALKTAACRETMEEANISLAEEGLYASARWLTPARLPKRFDTYFYYAEMPSQEVIVDGSEITDFQWLTTADALAMHHQGELALPPPTYVSLQHLSRYSSSKSVITNNATVTPFFEPILVKTDDGFCTLYREDAAYHTLDLADRSHQHRLFVRNGICEYIQD